jgi:hypothetical protein
MSRRHVMQSLEDVWADRLGVDDTSVVRDELGARFEHLSRYVLCGATPPAGQVPAEAAVAYGDLWVLAGFLADAQRALGSEETSR